MAWISPTSRAAGALITASIWNQDVVANPVAVHAGEIAVVSQAIGDLLAASSVTAFARLADIATGSALLSGGVGVAPAYGKVGLSTHVDGVLAKASQHAQTAYKDEANVFSLAGNSFSEILGVAKGLQFPATQLASSDANVLDDYEEGTWTPVIGGSGGTSGQTYTNQIGRYVKIGKSVTLAFLCELSNKGTITGSVEIQGLPFVADVTTDLRVAFATQWSNLATTWVNVIALGLSNSSVLRIRGTTAAATDNTTELTTADIGNTTTITAGVVYIASA